MLYVSILRKYVCSYINLHLIVSDSVGLNVVDDERGIDLLFVEGIVNERDLTLMIRRQIKRAE